MIAILGVAREEIGYFKHQAEILSERSFAGMSFFSGILAETEVVMVCSDIGKLPVAIATQIAIDRFEVDSLIVTGPAGPLVPYLQQGDMVIADRLIQYDSNQPKSENSGNNTWSDKSPIRTDSALLTRVSESYHGIFGGKSSRPQLVVGTVVSCDFPLTDRKVIGQLQRDYGVVAIDREGAVVARVCRANEKPLLLIRTVVDTPDGNFYNQFDAQLQVVPEYITALVKGVIAAPQTAPVV